MKRTLLIGLLLWLNALWLDMSVAVSLTVLLSQKLAYQHALLAAFVLGVWHDVSRGGTVGITSLWLTAGVLLLGVIAKQFDAPKVLLIMGSAFVLEFGLRAFTGKAIDWQPLLTQVVMSVMAWVVVGFKTSLKGAVYLKG